MRVPGPTIRRLVLYYRFLEEMTKRKEEEVISSALLGDGVGVTAAQVRKDLSYFGKLGCKGVGYDIRGLKKFLEKIIGFDRYWSVALIGAGNLGQALISYKKFCQLGFNIVEVFDNDLSKIGNRVGKLEVKNIKDLSKVISKKGIKIAILTIPVSAAQETAQLLIEVGIKAIWNFAPLPLKVSDDVLVIMEDLSSGIGSLIYNLKNSC
ncbi:MAG: redox-sensing transcriptional repressor Rex [Firmicutes bacterium]|nr:redox-sensing transcriptional repressor Rex [Bacillota bacterium]